MKPVGFPDDAACGARKRPSASPWSITHPTPARSSRPSVVTLKVGFTRRGSCAQDGARAAPMLRRDGVGEAGKKRGLSTPGKRPPTALRSRAELFWKENDLLACPVLGARRAWAIPVSGRISLPRLMNSSARRRTGHQVILLVFCRWRASGRCGKREWCPAFEGTGCSTPEAWTSDLPSYRNKMEPVRRVSRCNGAPAKLPVIA